MIVLEERPDMTQSPVTSAKTVYPAPCPPKTNNLKKSWDMAQDQEYRLKHGDNWHQPKYLNVPPFEHGSTQMQRYLENVVKTL